MKLLCKRAFQLKGHKKAITTFEIIVAVILLLFIAGALFFINEGFLRFSEKRETERKIKQIAKALEKYYRDLGTFPTDLIYLVTNPGNPSWRGPYFPGDIYDVKYDAWRNPFAYQFSSTGAVVWSYGPNRVNDSPSWTVGTGWSPGGDDIGTEVSPKLPIFDAEIETERILSRVVKKLEEEYMRRCLAEKFAGNPNPRRNYFSDFSIADVMGVANITDGFGNPITCNLAGDNSLPCDEWDFSGDCDPLPTAPVVSDGCAFEVRVFAGDRWAVAVGPDCAPLPKSSLGCINAEISPTGLCSTTGDDRVYFTATRQAIVYNNNFAVFGNYAVNLIIFRGLLGQTSRFYVFQLPVSSPLGMVCGTATTFTSSTRSATYPNQCSTVGSIAQIYFENGVSRVVVWDGY